MPVPIAACRGKVGRSAGNGLLTGLAAYWALDEASGNRADSSGNGLTLTEVGTLGTADGLVHAKAALCVEGADNYVMRARASCAAINWNSSTPFTIAYWGYPTSFAGGPDSPNFYKTVMSFGGGSSFTGGYWLITTALGQTYLAAGKTGGPPQYDRHVLNGYQTLNQWNLFVWTHDSNAMAYYLGGTLRDSDTNSYPFTSATGGDFYVGIKNTTVQNYAGRLGPVMMWSRALSAAEVTALYNGGAGLAYAQFTG